MSRESSSYEQPIASLLRYIPCVCGPLSSHWRNLAKHAGIPEDGMIRAVLRFSLDKHTQTISIGLDAYPCRH